MNLIEKYGSEWFSDKFLDCLFLYQGNILIVKAFTDDEQIVCVNRKENTYVKVPTSYFNASRVFSTPEIGWRSSKETGSFLAYMTKRNSYKRGITLTNLSYTISGPSKALKRFGTDKIKKEINEALEDTPYMVFHPHHMSLEEGLSALNDGSRLSFTLNHKIAVAVKSSRTYTVYVNQLPAGTITTSGKLTTDSPHLTKLLEKY